MLAHKLPFGRWRVIRAVGRISDYLNELFDLFEGKFLPTPGHSLVALQRDHRPYRKNNPLSSRGFPRLLPVLRALLRSLLTTFFARSRCRFRTRIARGANRRLRSGGESLGLRVQRWPALLLSRLDSNSLAVDRDRDRLPFPVYRRRAITF